MDKNARVPTFPRIVVGKKVDFLDNYLCRNSTAGIHVATGQSMEIVYTMSRCINFIYV